jgi:hypothetical protein
MAIDDDHAVAEGLVDVADRLGDADRELGDDLVPPRVGHVAQLRADLEPDVDEVAGAALGGRPTEDRAA